MKGITTIILILTLNLAYGQDTLQFRVTTPKGLKVQKTDTQTIVHSGKLNFEFFKKHFYVPYHYPDQFIDYRYKSDTITVWNDSTTVGDLESNWKYTIIYDTSSRVISYQYSACMVCSQLPYNYRFYYNEKGQVLKMSNNLNDDKTIEFQYDTIGNIIRIKVYFDSKLTKKIELINF